MVSFFKMESIKSFGVLRGWYLGKFNNLEATRLIESLYTKYLTPTDHIFRCMSGYWGAQSLWIHYFPRPTKDTSADMNN